MYDSFCILMLNRRSVLIKLIFILHVFVYTRYNCYYFPCVKVLCCVEHGVDITGTRNFSV